MKGFVSFREIEEIVRAKAGKSVRLSYGGKDETVAVGYTIEVDVPLLGKRQKDVSALLTIDGTSGLDLLVSYDLGAAMNLVAIGVKKLIGSYIEQQTSMASWGNTDKQVVLHLDKIARSRGIDIDKFTEQAELQQVTVTEGGVEVTIALRL